MTRRAVRGGSGPTFMLVGTGGSSGRTLAAVEVEILKIVPGARFAFVDTQAFNLRSGGHTVYPGQGSRLALTPSQCGITSFTGSQTTNLVLNGGPLAYRRIKRCADQAFASHPNVVVICHDRMYVETAILSVARTRGIPTVLLQEGPFCGIGNARPQAIALRIKAALAPLVTRTGILPPIPDYGLYGHARILAASQRYARKWVDAGVAQEAIVVTGVPRFDALHGRGAQTGPSRAPGPLRILYLAQPFAAHGKVDSSAADALIQLLASGLRDTAATLPYQLTVRAHPRAGETASERLGRQLMDWPELDDGSRPIEAAIGASDVVIGHYSTGLLEGLLLGKPVISLPVPRAAFAEQSEADKQAWLETIGIPVCRTAKELAFVLLRFSSGESRARAQADFMASVRWNIVEEETGPVNGQATQRAAKVLVGLASRHAGRTSI